MKELKINELLSALSELDVINSKLHGYCNGYSELRAVLEHSLTVFELAKFKVDDRVKLIITPEINEKTRWGWMGHKHYLVEGAVATIKNREFYNGKFTYSVTFDDESYLNYKTQEKIMTPPEDRGFFMIDESWLSHYE